MKFKVTFVLWVIISAYDLHLRHSHPKSKDYFSFSYNSNIHSVKLNVESF